MSVVRVRRQGGKVVQWCDIYVGRKCTMGGWDIQKDSKWANPYTIKQYGSEALIKYEQYVRKAPELWDTIEELDGKILGCWCTFDDRSNKTKSEICHAQVLLRLLEEKSKTS